MDRSFYACIRCNKHAVDKHVVDEDNAAVCVLIKDAEGVVRLGYYTKDGDNPGIWTNYRMEDGRITGRTIRGQKTLTNTVEEGDLVWHSGSTSWEAMSTASHFLDSQPALSSRVGPPDVEVPRPRAGMDARLAQLSHGGETQHMDTELEPEPESERAETPPREELAAGPPPLLADTQPGPRTQDADPEANRGFKWSQKGNLPSTGRETPTLGP